MQKVSSSVSVCSKRLPVGRKMNSVHMRSAQVHFASMMLDAFSITYRKRRVQGNPTNDSTFSSRLASCTAVGQSEREKEGEVRVRSVRVRVRIQ